ncbi:MAG: ABC transporter ATP-binding protein [Novosphingobium sp.]
MVSEPILALEGVTRRYGRSMAVDQASLTLHPGRIACLLGPSGCGKSTLLRLIAGLEPIDGGAVRIAGETVSAPGIMVPPERRGVGLVFQDNALFPHLDVIANIGFGLSALPAPERARRVDRLLAQFHIAPLARSFPHMLSGGEQQRVAIARALAREPALLLLDEPFSGLDGHLRETVRASLLGDLRAAEASVLVVTHDPAEAMEMADDLVLMAAGRILQTGTPADCYRRPVSSAAARLLGEMILLPGEVRGGTITTALGAMPAPGWPDGLAQLGLRPEALRTGGAGAAARVLAQRFVGNGWRLTLDLAGTPITLRLPEPVEGEVRLGFDPAAACLFSA